MDARQQPAHTTINIISLSAQLDSSRIQTNWTISTIKSQKTILIW